MKVLIACEFSGTVRDAFTARGHHAVSCDRLPSETPGIHIQGDVLEWLGKNSANFFDGWDLMIAHPPCTYLTNAGVTWLHRDKARWNRLDEGAAFFKKLLNCDIPKICVENPIMHKYAIERIGGIKQNQTIQPWMFGHMETKGTCLWLKELRNLIPTSNLKKETMALPPAIRGRLNWTPPSKDRWKIRSKTFQGIANAMADQWSDHLNFDASDKSHKMRK